MKCSKGSLIIIIIIIIIIILDQYGLENIGKWVEEIGKVLEVKLKCEPDLYDSLKQRYRNYKRSFKNKKGGRTQKLFRNMDRAHQRSPL